MLLTEALVGKPEFSPKSYVSLLLNKTLLGVQDSGNDFAIKGALIIYKEF